MNKNLAGDNIYWEKLFKKRQKEKKMIKSENTTNNYNLGVTTAASPWATITTTYVNGKKVEEVMTTRDNSNSTNIYFSSSVPPVTTEDFIPVKIIYNCPATICYFKDGTKEVVMVTPNEEYIEEVGVMACIMKRLFKSRNEFKRLVKSGYENEEAEVERVLHNAYIQKVRNDELLASLKAYTQKK
jgi:hypothetical protein